MTDSQLERLREIAELLAAASRDVDTMLWHGPMSHGNAQAAAEMAMEAA